MRARLLTATSFVPLIVNRSCDNQRLGERPGLHSGVRERAGISTGRALQDAPLLARPGPVALQYEVRFTGMSSLD